MELELLATPNSASLSKIHNRNGTSERSSLLGRLRLKGVEPRDTLPEDLVVTGRTQRRKLLLVAPAQGQSLLNPATQIFLAFLTVVVRFVASAALSAHVELLPKWFL